MSVERDGIEFGSLTDSDFQGISDLITRMDSTEADQRLRNKSEVYYRWMYQANPSGRAIVHSGRHQGRVVSSFAVAPKKVQVDGQEMVIGKTMDMFTDPAYQGKGLIKQCTTAVFEGARKAGIRGWYVTPSPNSYPIFKGKWGYREDLQLIYRSRILDYSKVLAAAIKPPLLGRAAGSIVDIATHLVPHQSTRFTNGYEARQLHDFGPEVDVLWTKVRPGYRVALVRD
ncbi:GNAT family N-acetyltransferase, partial [Microlunatus aurantiacus]